MTEGDSSAREEIKAGLLLRKKKCSEAGFEGVCQEFLAERKGKKLLPHVNVHLFNLTFTPFLAHGRREVGRGRDKTNKSCSMCLS